MIWAVLFLIFAVLIWLEVIPAKRWLYSACITVISKVIRFFIDCLHVIK